MLGEDPGLRRFVDAVAQRNGGRVFSPDIDGAGPLRGRRLRAGPPRPPLTARHPQSLTEAGRLDIPAAAASLADVARVPVSAPIRGRSEDADTM